MFRFSFRQCLLLSVGCVLILLSVFLNRVAVLWEDMFSDGPVIWHQLEILPGHNAYVSTLDTTTLVVRSASHSEARLTLFTREDDGSKPSDLVEDLCGRDSCVYLPLEDVRLNGAIADYSSGTPLRIVLMHPAENGIWLEYKGPPEQLETFNSFINSIVLQMRAQSRGDEDR